MSCAANYLKRIYLQRTPEASKAIHIYSSALKATLTWQNMITLQVHILLSCLHIYPSSFRRTLISFKDAFGCIRSVVKPVVAKV